MSHAVKACPACGAADKVLDRCRNCLTLCCTSCSVTNACKDCYALLNKEYEVIIYHKDKERKGVLASSVVLLALFFLSFLPAVGAVLSDGMTACYDFEGDMIDALGAYNGSNSFNSPTNVSGRIGRGLGFEEDDTQGISISSIPINESQFTISLWFRSPHLNDDGITRSLFSRRSDAIVANPVMARLFSGSSGVTPEARFFVGDGAAETQVLDGLAGRTANLWIQEIFWKNGSDYRIYDNGILIGSAVDGTTVTDDSSKPFFIGRQSGVSQQFFDGSMDEFMVWNRALDDDEILQVWKNSSGVRCDFVPDTTPPAFSNNLSTPLAPMTYNPSGSVFSVDWLDDYAIDTVLIENDFSGGLQNDPTTVSGNTYSYSRTLAVGNYSWRMLANDTSGNLVYSDQYYYEVVPAPYNLSLFLNGIQSGITVSPNSTVNATATLTQYLADIDLFLDGMIRISGASPLQNLSFLQFEGGYNFTAVVNGSQNYSTTSVTLFATVREPFVFPFTAGVCPTSSLPLTIMYVFIGMFMLSLLLVNELWIKVPIFGIVAGMGFIMYSFTMFGCDTIIGYVVLTFGVGVILYEIVKGFSGE